MRNPEVYNGGRWQFWALFITLLLNILNSWATHGAIMARIDALAAQVQALQQLIFNNLHLH